MQTQWIEYYLKFLGDNADWKLLSQNPNITMQVVLAHDPLGKPWNWKWVSSNFNITMKDVLAHPEMPWDWKWLSENPNITMNDVLAHPVSLSGKPWNWYGLSANPMSRDKNEFYRERIYEFLTPYFNDDLAWLVSMY